MVSRVMTVTRVDRLSDLFAAKSEIVDPRKTSNETRRRGGIANLARVLDIEHATISRWNSTGKRGKHGNIPPEFNARIVAAADEHGIPRAALQGILDCQTCPTCGQALPEGQLIGER